MTLRIRRRIFYTLVALFILVGGGVVFYAQGWRVDLATGQFAKVGGIYVRSFPEDASIYLDGKPIQNQSGFLSPGTLISNLLPRTYSVTLKAADYDEWQENAQVSPSLVVQFKAAVLVPQNGTAAASGTVRLLLAANATSSTIDRYDQTQKIVAGQNKIFIFNIPQATTTLAIKVPGKNLEAKWISGSMLGIFQNDGELYRYDINAQALTKLADDVKDFSATNGGGSIAALENKSLEIFSFGGETNYYRFNLPNIALAQRVFWYKDGTHLFVVYPDHVSFLDLADVSLTNFITVARGTSPVYSADANALYIKDPAGAFLRYDFPN